MKKLLDKIKFRYIPWIILIICLALLIPSLVTRLDNEGKNRNVTVALLYNDILGKVSPSKLDESLAEYAKIGVDTVAVMEDDINAMVARGELTCLKYNVLLHKYDDESMRVADAIKKAIPDITYDSYVILAKRAETREKLSYNLPRRFSEKDYTHVGFIENMDIYVFHDGHKALWDFAIGYDEADLDYIASKGMKIALIHKVKNYDNTEYLKDIERIVKEYDVEYLNLKADSEIVAEGTGNTENYIGLCDIISENDLTLVVTENVDQLSNQKFYGYNYVFNTLVKSGNESKVVRSYETYDDSQVDASNYKYRTTQYFNSTVDRNTRFVTVTQIATPGPTYNQLADYTFTAVKEYLQKIADEGYTVNGKTNALNYIPAKSMNYALSAVIMVMAAMIMINTVFGGEYKKLTALSVALAILAFTITLFAPARLSSLIALYPTVYSAVMSCFTMTVVLYMLKNGKRALFTGAFTVSVLVVTMASLFIGSIGMGSMLSGIDYYINNDIFRGIKLSLLAPIAYTAVAYYIMYMRNENSNILKDAVKILNADIKVYWVLIAGVVGFVGIYYILRSGNVESISSVEATMRNTLTEMFTERPRTKEFLIGYPCLVLLCYYFKNTSIKLIQWLLAIASSILAASVTNSFCHVFTDYKVIVKRTLNGLIIGIIVAAVAIIANMILVKAVKKISKKLQSEE